MHKWLEKLGDYYLIPHELLHVWGYRLLNKPYYYQWGSRQVVPLAERTRNERLFISLLPFMVSWFLGGISYLLWFIVMVYLAVELKMPPEKFFFEAPPWHFILMLIGSIFIIYSGTAHGDLINTYYLLLSPQEKNKTNEGCCDPQNEANEQKIQRNDPQTPDRNIAFISRPRSLKKNALKSGVIGNTQEKEHAHDDIERG